MFRVTMFLLLIALAVGCARPADSTQPAPTSQPGGPLKTGGVDPQVEAKVDPVAEEKAAQFVLKLGGKVERDPKQPGNPVVKVVFNGPQVSDADLKHLAPLKDLTELYLSFTQVTDAGLKELAAFPKLSKLLLGGTKVTDAGMKDIATLRNLTVLVVGPSRVTGAGVRELIALDKLERLNLDDTPALRDGLKQKDPDTGLRDFMRARPNCKIED